MLEHQLKNVENS